MKVLPLYDGVDDKALVEKLRESDMVAFNTIYFRYAATLYDYSLNILMDEDECTDAVQDIFVWLWENRSQLNITHLKGYLLAAVKYKLTRLIISSRRREEILKKVPSPAEEVTEENMELKELKAAIHDFIATLPPQAKKIFQMSREQYLTNREIGQQLGLSEKTVRNQLTITLRKLKSYLGRLSCWSVFL
ncbi:sigma-70 family RNA polymerase sigma factor [Chitinophaga eiseniae]|uniref:Sigma-70 family RNA polymerase sigma factor n=1 Tax=Chitinophaga eiseniae TaxID=634771 RepID=A0A847SJC5_9BACT|nr:sigma-70 family RNA polymerase sigma factor [Chitinophaga eiseniae]NLR79863.1 sigma-70 family RNA polymerase sigma factor [Chitinophaga eiseniae]